MVRIERGPGDLDFITWKPEPEENSLRVGIDAALARIGDHLRDTGSVLLHLRGYGTLDGASEFTAAYEAFVLSAASAEGISPTFVEGPPCEGSGLAGLHAIAARAQLPTARRVIRFRGRPCGVVVEGRKAEYLYLSDVSRFASSTSIDDPVAETEAAFDLARSILEENGWQFTDTCRTWFYLRDILDWYDDFNAVRNRFFRAIGLFDETNSTMIPASTGIFGRNARAGWCTLDLLAIRAVGGGDFRVERLANPKQNEAPDYGSAFSRGLAVTANGSCSVWMSGTASIDDSGASIHVGDFRRQTEQTLETIQTLLEQGGARLEDIVQATAFIKNAEDVPVFHEVIRRRGLEELPMICVLADVCREELLFELDATALPQR